MRYSIMDLETDINQDDLHFDIDPDFEEEEEVTGKINRINPLPLEIKVIILQTKGQFAAYYDREIYTVQCIGENSDEFLCLTSYGTQAFIKARFNLISRFTISLGL